MSDPPPSKRARTDEPVTSEQDAQQQRLADRLTRTVENKEWVEKVENTLDIIPRETLYSLVIAAAARDPDLESSLEEAAAETLSAAMKATDEELKAEREAAATEIINFDHLSKQVRYELSQYSYLSYTLQYDKAEEALDVVVDCIAKIRKQTPINASFGTKRSALENLRKIAKSICCHNSKAGNNLGCRGIPLRDTMVEIAIYMTDEDIARVMTLEFEGRLVELECLAQSQISLRGLRLEGIRYALTGDLD